LGAQEGRLFQPLELTKTLVMAASALLAVTLVPVAMGFLIEEGSGRRRQIPSIAGGKLENRIGDRRMLALIRRFLGAGMMADGAVVERYEGTPQGGPLSPLLANVLLDEVDKELERRGHAVRSFTPMTATCMCGRGEQDNAC
jgi:hypothetical protein